MKLFFLKLRPIRALLFLAVAAASFAACSSYPTKHMMDTSEKPRLAVKPDKAILVIIRPSTIVAPIQVFGDYIDGKMVGETRNKTYIVTEVQPGVHYVMGKAQNMATARINFEAGRIYFLKQDANRGWGYPRTSYSPLLLDEAKKQLSDEGYGYLAYDAQHPGDDLSSNAYETTKGDFEREIHEDPARYKAILEYRGYDSL